MNPDAVGNVIPIHGNFSKGNSHLLRQVRAILDSGLPIIFVTVIVAVVVLEWTVKPLEVFKLLALKQAVFLDLCIIFVELVLVIPGSHVPVIVVHAPITDGITGIDGQDSAAGATHIELFA